jgi:riboflavin kinase/FMN adenylyltransferase
MFRAYWGLDEVPDDFSPAAVTIGNFDGIHIGHRKILDTTRARAGELGCQAAVLIFDPHPMKVVAPERAPLLLTRPAERLRRFEELGMDAAVVLRFSEETARLSPEEFVADVLVAKLHCRAVVVGDNFRFGHRQRGDFTLLAALGKQYGFEAQAVGSVAVGGQPASSSRVRDLARRGEMALARRVLGRPFSLEGPIVSGHGIGAKQTVPTLNLDPETELLPAQGVYVTETRHPHSGRCWPSVTNIGSRPTFDGTGLHVETYLLSKLEGVSPERIELLFHRRLRDEKKFSSPEELRQQILVDAGRAERFLRLLRAVGREPVSRKNATEPCA